MKMKLREALKDPSKYGSLDELTKKVRNVLAKLGPGNG
jgi:hypothetical protein